MQVRDVGQNMRFMREVYRKPARGVRWGRRARLGSGRSGAEAFRDKGTGLADRVGAATPERRHWARHLTRRRTGRRSPIHAVQRIRDHIASHIEGTTPLPGRPLSRLSRAKCKVVHVLEKRRSISGKAVECGGAYVRPGRQREGDGPTADTGRRTWCEEAGTASRTLALTSTSVGAPSPRLSHVGALGDRPSRGP